jgi:hypothetical protein
VIESLKDIAQRFLRSRQRHYIETFEGPGPQNVLKDLAKFCRAHKSTFHPNPQVAARLDGRREVWNRIASHLNLDDEKLWQMYGKNTDK